MLYKTANQNITIIIMCRDKIPLLYTRNGKWSRTGAGNAYNDQRSPRSHKWSLKFEEISKKSLWAKFGKIDKSSPWSSKFGKFGPWKLIYEKMHQGPLNIQEWSSLALEECLQKLADSVLIFSANYKTYVNTKPNRILSYT